MLETRVGAGLGKEGAWIVAGAVGTPGRSGQGEGQDKYEAQAWSLCPSLQRSRAAGSPKPSLYVQAEVAVPAAIPVAVAEAEVTLQELQEALEEEMLTRQSLSRELEAIRMANQNFAR